MHNYIHIFTYIRIYIYIYTYRLVHTHTRTHTHAHTHTHTCIHTNIYIHVYVDALYAPVHSSERAESLGARERERERNRVQVSKNHTGKVRRSSRNLSARACTSPSPLAPRPRVFCFLRAPIERVEPLDWDGWIVVSGLKSFSRSE